MVGIVLLLLSFLIGHEVVQCNIFWPITAEVLCSRPIRCNVKSDRNLCLNDIYQPKMSKIPPLVPTFIKWRFFVILSLNRRIIRDSHHEVWNKVFLFLVFWVSPHQSYDRRSKLQHSNSWFQLRRNHTCRRTIGTWHDLETSKATSWAKYWVVRFGFAAVGFNKTWMSMYRYKFCT